jgi:hypothetical protein
MYMSDETYAANLPLFIEHGRYLDLLMLASVRDGVIGGISSPELDLFKAALSSGEPALAAKWAPSEGGRFNRYAGILAKKLKMTKREYRKFLTERRAKLHLVETALCAQKYEDITFSHVPSQAMLRYREAFKRSTNAAGKESTTRKTLADRYQQYLTDVAAGKEKINTGTVMPHQIVHAADTVDDRTLDVAWNDVVKRLADVTPPSSFLANSMAIIDTSGSMESVAAGDATAMDVAIALGMLITEISRSAERQYISFSSEPKLVKLPEGTVHTKVNAVKRTAWSMNTNMMAVFELLLTLDTPVKNLFIFTDMQFDSAVGQPDTTLYEKVKRKYTLAERELPQIVFWNIGGKALPVTKDETGTAYISGFSSQLLRVFMNNQPIDPLSIMRETLAKYQVVVPGDEAVTNADSTLDWSAIWPKITKILTHPTPVKTAEGTKTPDSLPDLIEGGEWSAEKVESSLTGVGTEDSVTPDSEVETEVDEEMKVQRFTERLLGVLLGIL